MALNKEQCKGDWNRKRWAKKQYARWQRRQAKRAPENAPRNRPFWGYTT